MESIVDELKQIHAAELQKLKNYAEAEFRKAENKIIEVETDIEKQENFLPVKFDDCIFFDSANFDDDNLTEETKTFSYGAFFLCVDYGDIKNYLHKDYQGADFTYQLTPDTQFVELEEKFLRISKIYNVPVQIYSPFARRAVNIKITDKQPEDFKKLADLDFKLAENNLSGKLLLNKKFFWNVEIKTVNESWSKFENDLYNYGFDNSIDAETYILPATDSAFDDEIEAEKTADAIILKSPKTLPESFELIKILPVENKISPRIFSKPRLRTQGDIEFVLKCFERENFSCSFGSFGGEGKKILRYSKENKYPTSQDENLLRAKMKLPTVNVKFHGAGIFLIDYANYVLHFLEENYPEFNWTGENDD